MPHSNPLQPLHDEDQEAYAEIDRFQDALRRCGGRAGGAYLRHFQQIQKSLRFFEDYLLPHMENEEAFVFPFLEEHLPRLESVIALLLSEHEDFRQILIQLKSWIQSLGEFPEQSPILWEKIKTQGFYLSVLLKTHIWAESHGIYKPAEEELNLREKQSLERLLKKKTPHSIPVPASSSKLNLETWYSACGTGACI